MDNIDIYTWVLFVLWDHMFEETSMKVPKHGSIPGKIDRILEAMFPFLEWAYPWPQQLVITTIAILSDLGSIRMSMRINQERTD